MKPNIVAQYGDFNEANLNGERLQDSEESLAEKKKKEDKEIEIKSDV